MGSKKQTYLDTVEDYLKYVANNKRDEFIKKNPEASNREADILYNRAFELYKSNELFRSKLEADYQDKKEEVRNRHEESIKRARSLGDATENNYKRAETLGPEGLSLVSKKRAETLGPEGLSIASKKAHKTLGPEGRSKRAKKRAENMGPEKLSKANKKRAKTIGKRGLSKISNKGKKTMGPKRLSEITKIIANRIHVFETGYLAKGSTSKTKYIKDHPNSKIIKTIVINEDGYEDLLIKWEIQQKKLKDEMYVGQSYAQSFLTFFKSGEITKGTSAKSKHVKKNPNDTIIKTIRYKNGKPAFFKAIKEYEVFYNSKQDELNKNKPLTKKQKIKIKEDLFLQNLPNNNITWDLIINATIKSGYTKRQAVRLKDLLKIQDLVKYGSKTQWSKCIYTK